MRPTILMFILGVAQLAEAQQDYLPMLAQGRTWCGIEGGWVPTPVTYWVEGDTLLPDSTLWHRLAIQYEGSPNAGFAGWFHEDLEAGQVWNRWDLDLDEGTLWFDFNLQPGDVMVAPNCDWANITCLAVEPFTWTDGTVSRRLTMELMPGNTEFVEHWIEGIGSENGPMGPAAYLCLADWDPLAACFMEGGALRHDFALDTTWLPSHPGCTDTVVVNQLNEQPGLSGSLVVDKGRLRWIGHPVPETIALHDILGRSLGSFPGISSWPIPATGGLLIATLPDGRRQKIRID